MIGGRFSVFIVTSSENIQPDTRLRMNKPVVSEMSHFADSLRINSHFIAASVFYTFILKMYWGMEMSKLSGMCARLTMTLQ